MRASATKTGGSQILKKKKRNEGKVIWGIWSAWRWHVSHSVIPALVIPWTVIPSQRSLPGSSAQGEEYTGAGCHFLLQGIFPTQGSNSHLLHWQADSLLLSHVGSPWGTLIYVPSSQSALSRERLEKQDWKGKQCGRTCKCRRGSAKESKGETRVTGVGERRYSTRLPLSGMWLSIFHTPSQSIFTSPAPPQVHRD